MWSESQSALEPPATLTLAETPVRRRLRHQHVCPADLVREYHAGDVPLEDIHYLFAGCVVALAGSIKKSLTSAAVLNYRYTQRKEMSAGSSGHLDGTTVSDSLLRIGLSNSCRGRTHSPCGTGRSIAR